MPYSATFIYFQGLLRRIFAFVKSRRRASCAILKHYLVIARGSLWSKISIKPLSKVLYQSQGTVRAAAKTSNLIRRTRVLKENAIKFIAKCLNFTSKFHSVPPLLAFMRRVLISPRNKSRAVINSALFAGFYAGCDRGCDACTRRCDTLRHCGDKILRHCG